MSLQSGREYRETAMGQDIELSPNFATDKDGNYTPPKLGGKEAKDARRYAQSQRVNDEIIIYASVMPKTNKFTGKKSKHTGQVTLYLFLLDRNLEQ